MKKEFDCVEMKNRIQQKMREDEECIGVEAARARRREWLDHGDDPLAVWWRSLSVRSQKPVSIGLVRDEESGGGGTPGGNKEQP